MITCLVLTNLILNAWCKIDWLFVKCFQNCVGLVQLARAVSSPVTPVVTTARALVTSMLDYCVSVRQTTLASSATRTPPVSEHAALRPVCPCVCLSVCLSVFLSVCLAKC